MGLDSTLSASISSVNFTDEVDCSKKKKYCKGKRTFEDGSIYEGEFRYGQPHGYGTLVWPNGDTFSGNFSSGLRHGIGIQKFHNGDSYEGRFPA